MRDYRMAVLVTCTIALCAKVTAQVPPPSGDSARPGRSDGDRETRISRAGTLAARGMVHYCKGDKRAAESEFREAVRLWGEGTPMAWHGLALVYADEGRVHEAIDAYRMIVRKGIGSPGNEYSLDAPNPGLAHLELALLLNRSGQAAEAVDLWRNEFARGSGFDSTQEPVPVTWMFDVRSPQRDSMPERLDAALHVAIGLIRMAGSHLGCPYDPAAIDQESSPSREWIALNEKAALAQFRAAVKSQPDSGFAQFYLGYELSLHGGSKIEAVRALDRAAAFGPDAVREAVRQFRATGKVSLPGLSRR